MIQLRSDTFMIDWDTDNSDYLRHTCHIEVDLEQWTENKIYLDLHCIYKSIIPLLDFFDTEYSSLQKTVNLLSIIDSHVF